jgi:protein-serine/threonine kinase
MQQLLCEPADRLGSQATASTIRPNYMVVQARRSGFIAASGSTGSVDGAELIKVRGSDSCLIPEPAQTETTAPHCYVKAHPWFRGIDWANIRRYPAPYRPELRSPDDTRHFDPDIPPEVRSISTPRVDWN